MIRDFKNQDLDKVMELWLATNISAHSFIEKKYWIQNFDAVKDMMLDASIFICENADDIQGFIGLIDDYIAGLFVFKKFQSKGTGKHLLDYAKSKHSHLSLNVYKSNERAVKFYLREDFFVVNEQIDEKTGEIELEMNWIN